MATPRRASTCQLAHRGLLRLGFWFHGCARVWQLLDLAWSRWAGPITASRDSARGPTGPLCSESRIPPRFGLLKLYNLEPAQQVPDSRVVGWAQLDQKKINSQWRRSEHLFNFAKMRHFVKWSYFLKKSGADYLRKSGAECSSVLSILNHFSKPTARRLEYKIHLCLRCQCAHRSTLLLICSIEIFCCVGTR